MRKWNGSRLIFISCLLDCESSQFSLFLLSLLTSVYPHPISIPCCLLCRRRSQHSAAPSPITTLPCRRPSRSSSSNEMFVDDASFKLKLLSLSLWVVEMGVCEMEEAQWWSGASSSFPAHNFRPANPIGVVNDPVPVPVPTEMVSCVYYFEIC